MEGVGKEEKERERHRRRNLKGLFQNIIQCMCMHRKRTRQATHKSSERRVFEYMESLWEALCSFGFSAFSFFPRILY